LSHGPLLRRARPVCSFGFDRLDPVYVEWFGESPWRIAHNVSNKWGSYGELATTLEDIARKA